MAGESEENMRRAIHLAEAVNPCVLWIDEMKKLLLVLVVIVAVLM